MNNNTQGRARDLLFEAATLLDHLAPHDGEDRAETEDLIERLAAAAERVRLIEAVVAAAEALDATGGDDPAWDRPPWWAWGRCVGCEAEAGPPNGTGYDHTSDCPAVALSVAIRAMREEVRS